MMFENRIHWKVSGPKKEEIRGGRRERNNTYIKVITSHKILLGWSRNEMGRACITYSEKNSAYRNLKGTWKDWTFWKHMHRKDVISKMDLEAIRWQDLDWINLAVGRENWWNLWTQQLNFGLHKSWAFRN